MSGHSHWATIKRQKEAADKQRGQIFSKLSRAITVAARQGADPETNFKLRLAIEKAKEYNLPKENILRAIRRGSGQEEGEKWEEITFEGYGPEGIGVIVETVTDNRNRTTAEIKNIFERGGGNLAGPGAVSYLFRKTGLITVKKEENLDEQILKLIDLGAEDVEEATDAIEVYTSPENLKDIEEKIKNSSFEVKSAEIIMKPVTPVVISDPQKAQKVLRFMDNLENHDDVQKIYANFDIPNEILAEVSPA
jgi:YebC/PmpR family DNA-binding regulatory protein